MALVGIELETLASESDALTTRPPPCACDFTLSGFCRSNETPRYLVLAD